jgi:hypothetical protein
LNSSKQSQKLFVLVLLQFVSDFERKLNRAIEFKRKRTGNSELVTDSIFPSSWNKLAIQKGKFDQDFNYYDVAAAHLVFTFDHFVHWESQKGDENHSILIILV